MSLFLFLVRVRIKKKFFPRNLSFIFVQYISISVKKKSFVTNCYLPKVRDFRLELIDVFSFLNVKPEPAIPRRMFRAI